jgi:ligand-binding sensor domain-containing protein
MSAAATAHAEEASRAIPPATDIALRGKPALRVFTDKDGLPQNTVAAQAFDADGRLWVGTQEGLAFYDGHSFQRVPFPDDGAEWVTALAELSDGSLAVGTHAAGLWLVKGNHFEHVDAKSGHPDDAVLSVADENMVAPTSAVRPRGESTEEPGRKRS